MKFLVALVACSDAELMLIPPEDDGLRRGKDDGEQPGSRHHQPEREVEPDRVPPDFQKQVGWGTRLG